MPSVVLIHWNAEEASARIRELRAAGFDVRLSTPASATDLKKLGDAPPDCFVIDLSRLPSQGRDIGGALRRQKTTRRAGLVFAGGQPEKVAAARAVLPDAIYTEWEGIAAALRRAAVERPSAPVVPGAMAGYSGRPLPAKLGIRDGAPVAMLGAPRDFAAAAGLAVTRGSAGRVLLFVKSRAELEGRFRSAAERVEPGGGLWIVWPKKTSGIASDLTQQGVREFGLAAGWVDYKICAVDQTWSGLLFARRVSR